MQYIKEIAIFLVVVNLLSILINNDSYKKYMKIFSGLILILIIIKPLKIFISEKSFEEVIDRKITEYDIVEMNQSLDNINEEAGKNIKSMYEEKISKEIFRFLLENKIEAERVETELEIHDNQLVFKKVDIKLDKTRFNKIPEEMGDDYAIDVAENSRISEVKIDYVNQLIAKEYGIERERIYIN